MKLSIVWVCCDSHEPHSARIAKKLSPMLNQDIAELLAIAAESAQPPANKALRRAARAAHLWPEEAEQLVKEGRSLTEFAAIGPYVEKRIRAWMDDPPPASKPPEIRRDFLTWTDARAVLQKKPSWLKGIKGDLQMHTQRSDGSGSVADMAEEASQRGYEYIAITDHAQALKIAGGINAAQLQQQAGEIQVTNQNLNSAGKTLRVLRSIELNLNPAGAGDMESSVLRKLQIVLGCFHSSLRKKEDQTQRYLAALRNPDVHILGHPRGRIYNFRLGLVADWERVFRVAAELDKAMEIDCYPDRQDLNLKLLRLAAKADCRISLGTDAHGPAQLRFIEFGAAASLLAGIKRDRILNFMDREQLLEWAESLRKK